MVTRGRAEGTVDGMFLREPASYQASDALSSNLTAFYTRDHGSRVFMTCQRSQQVSGRARPRSLLHADYSCPIGLPCWCGWHAPGSCPGCQYGACINQGALSGFSASLALSLIPNLLRSGRHCSWVLGFLSCPCSIGSLWGVSPRVAWLGGGRGDGHRGLPSTPVS